MLMHNFNFVIMNIVIIGSGNVAYHLAKAFKTKNLEIRQLFGRNTEDLKSISDELEIPYSTSILENADLYVIAVSDSAIAEVSTLITNEKAIVVHTSGSLPIDVLQGDYKKASFYPLQTFSRNKDLDYSEIPFFIEAQDEETQSTLEKMAQSISKFVEISSYEKRKYIHLTAVFSCNFVNHLFARAKEISDAQGIVFDYFLPLIQETFDKIKSMEPKLAQTGPAVRNDVRVLDLHKDLIKNQEQLLVYNTMNASIKKMYDL